jgi:hypothetical protein
MDSNTIFTSLFGGCLKAADKAAAAAHLAGVVFEAVAVLGLFAVDLLTGQVVARMERRERNKLAKAA